MQRKHIWNEETQCYQGNISAHAEKTEANQEYISFLEKHLCACRENHVHYLVRLRLDGNISAHAEKTFGHFSSSSHGGETSLRMQRKRSSLLDVMQNAGNISAYAEKTTAIQLQHEGSRKHLCACRENRAIRAASCG